MLNSHKNNIIVMTPEVMCVHADLSVCVCMCVSVPEGMDVSNDTSRCADEERGEEERKDEGEKRSKQGLF